MKKKYFIYAIVTTLWFCAFTTNVEAQFWRKFFGHKNTQQKKKKEIADSATINVYAAEPKETKKEKRKSEKLERKKRKIEKYNQKHNQDKISGVKRFFGKSKAEKKRTTEIQTTKKKKSSIAYPPTQIKSRYRIDVLASIYLDELVKGKNVTFKDKIPDKAAAGISFYEGVMIAVDSLKRAKFDFDFYIHDVSSNYESTDSLIENDKLDTSDLIIGAVTAHDLPMLASYSKSKHINFISALSPTDAGIKNNQFFTLIQPTLKSHCEWIFNDLAKKHVGQRILLVYRNTQTGDENAYKFLTSDSASGKVVFRTILANSLPNKTILNRVIDKEGPNVLVIPVLDILYADSLIKEFNNDFPGVSFEIYGMPTWAGSGMLKRFTENNSMKINITVPFNFDAGNANTAYVDAKFKKVYGGKTPELAYRGYETVMWYGNMLRKHGTIFNTEYNDISSAPFTKFNISLQKDKAGKILYNENKHIIQLQYANSNMVVLE